MVETNIPKIPCTARMTTQWIRLMINWIIKRHIENPLEGDRGGGGKRFLEHLTFEWRGIEGRVKEFLLVLT